MLQRLRRLTARIPESAIAALLLILSLVVCGIVFAKLDRRYSLSVLAGSSVQPACFIPDPLLHHSFKPNCETIAGWGRTSYPLFTNSLALRDERIGDVPLTAKQPRILLLGDSFTAGVQAWDETFAGMIAAHFPQLRVLNGGQTSYAPSNYLNLTKRLLDAKVEFDEVIVFIDMSDIQDEAAYYRDNETGGLDGPSVYHATTFSRWRADFTYRYMLTDTAVSYLEYFAIRHGFYFKPLHDFGNVFDLPRSAWTYRPVSDALPFISGYGPLGLAGGIAKAQTKMTALWQELKRRGIPLSVVVYPWPAQLAHDVVESRQVTLWREWCEGKCKRFISVFPDFFAVKNQCHWYAPGCWYDYFVFGDIHYNARGNRMVADAVIRRLAEDSPKKLPPN
jgi:hypothetical protein